jgi:phosphatidylinositol alpha 1,6-mannosyltransferase
MASGLPVIAPNAGGPRDLVDHGRTGFLLPAHDADRFCAELRSTVDRLTDESLRRRMAMAARSAVLGRTWSAVCDELVGHYDAVAGWKVNAA